MNKQDWTYKKLGEVANVTDYVANGSFATLRENVHYLDTDGYAILVRLADHTNNFDSSRFVYIDEHAYNFLSKSKLYGGEIIMSNVGSIGKSFICPKLSKPMSLAPNSIVINTSNNRFYFYYFNSPSFQSSLKTISSKTALPKFNKTQFKGLCAPVPPIEEQEQIVAELDLLQGIIEKKKEQLKAYDQLAQSIFYTMFGDPIDNPKGWETKKLGEVASLITDGDWIESKDQSDNGIRLIQTGNIGSGFFIAKDDKPHFISETTFYSLGCTEVFVGDCLISRLPSPVGRACLIPKTDYRMITAVDCSIVRFKDIILPQFFINYSLSSGYQAEIDRKTTGTTRKRISRKNLERIPVPVPPLSLQQEFAEKVEAIERQKALVQQSIVETQTMFDCTMDKYFG